MALEDLVNWLKALFHWFAALPRPPPLKGILELDDAACRLTLEAANGNIRATVMRGLLLREDAVRDAMEYFPDVCVLAEVVFSAPERSNVFELLDAFRESCDDWDDILDARDGKNRKAKKARAAAAAAAAAAAVIDGAGTGAGAGAGVGDDDEAEAAAAAALPSKKSEDAILRCRFVQALNSLERAGVVRLRQGSHEVTRLTFMWMAI